jgi:hypothetical protein
MNERRREDRRRTERRTNERRRQARREEERLQVEEQAQEATRRELLDFLHEKQSASQPDAAPADTTPDGAALPPTDTQEKAQDV